MPPRVSGFVVLALAAGAAGFGTINAPALLKQHNEHEMITRLAFQCPSGQKSNGDCFEPRSLDQLAGYHVNVMGIAITGAGVNGAVGAPDTFDPIPEGPEAHCDDADFLDVPGYPRTREEATAKLQECIDHLRHRFRQAVTAADRLLDERNRIRRDMVRISTLYSDDCTFAFPSLQSDSFGRAKCSTIEGLGRALHGIQDFYAHSNWVDSHNPDEPISLSNPPGLGMNGTAPFFDLRANGTVSPDEIPRNLTTGCFALPDVSLGSGACQGRITHHDLSKDKGVIHLDGSFGTVDLDPRSEAVPSNFHRAVMAAVQHSREAWDSFRDAVRDQYGTVRGDLMICSLVSDDPIKDCRQRTLAIAVDVSSPSEASGGILVEQQLVDGLTAALDRHGKDSVALIGNRAQPVLCYPMGPPVNATLDLPQPSGMLCMAGGLELSIAETIKAQPETYVDRAAIVLLTTGAEPLEFSGDTLQQLRRAKEEGIRVHYACVKMPRGAGEDGADRATWVQCSPGDAPVPAALRTGGVAAFLDGFGVSTPAHLVRSVMDRGLTATDDADESEDAVRPTRLYAGITLAEFLNLEHPTRSFLYPVTAGENLTLTVKTFPLDSQGAEDCFTVTFWYRYSEIEISTHARCGHSSPLSLVYKASESFDLVMEATYKDAARKDEVLRQEDILFSVTLDTDMPDKNETTVGTTTSILSSSATVQVPGSAAEGFLTSEAVEIRTSTASANGSVSTATESHGMPAHKTSPLRRPPEEFASTCGVPTLSAATAAGNYSVDFDAGQPPGDFGDGFGVLFGWG